MIETISYKRGDILCNEGDYEHFMYDICEGKVGIIKDLDMPTEREIATIDNGFVGEMGMLKEFPRTASVVALTDCKVVRIDSTSLDDYLIKNPEKSYMLLKMLAERLRETDKKYLSACQTISDYLNTSEDKTSIISRMQEYKNMLKERGL